MRGWIVLSVLLTACGGSPDATDAAQSADAELGSLEAPADVSAPPENAEVTPSGLASRVLKAGTGTDKPGSDSRVTVHYTGWTASDGNRFDSSRERDQPTSFGLQQVIAGWTEGLQLMVEGEHRRFWIPEELAYKGQPGKPAGMLVFDVELISFRSPPKPSADFTTPTDGRKTESGITVKTITAGKGSNKPTENDRVEFQFTMWKPDGTQLDSSFAMPRAPFSKMPQLPKAWRETIMTMTEGEKVDVWVPPGVDTHPGAPSELYVMELELSRLVKPKAAPADLKAPPADAVKTDSGLVMKTLQAGSDPTPLTERDAVSLHFTIWKAADGEELEDTYGIGQPARIPLGRLSLAGWKEAALRMTKGEKARVWIPEALAFAGQPGAPEGDLVMDLEIVDVMRPPTPPPAPLPPRLARPPPRRPPPPHRPGTDRRRLSPRPTLVESVHELDSGDCPFPRGRTRCGRRLRLGPRGVGAPRPASRRVRHRPAADAVASVVPGRRCPRGSRAHPRRSAQRG